MWQVCCGRIRHCWSEVDAQLQGDCLTRRPSAAGRGGWVMGIVGSHTQVMSAQDMLLTDSTYFSVLTLWGNLAVKVKEGW